MKLVAILAVLAVAAPAVAEEQLRWTRTVHADDHAPIVIEPDGPMFAHARIGFADLRVLDANGSPVPWRPLPPPSAASFERVRVLNSGRQGGRAVALLDLGRRREVRDRVELDVPGRGFVGRVAVLGADRPEGPFTHLSTTGIYDVRGARRARSTTAVFPATIHRYLLLRATGVSRIDGAAVSGSEGRPPIVQRPARRITTREVGRRTIIRLDFGARNLPVEELRIFAGAKQYDRPVVIEASNNSRSWRFAGGARISRFPGSAPGPIAIDVRARYIRVTIDNGDDPPLTGIRIEANSRSHAIVLEDGHPFPFRLLYGDPDLNAPDYEFARIPFPPTRATVPGVLGAERANPAFDLPEQPFGERYRWLLQVALAAAALVVAAGGFLALRRRA